MLVQLIVPHLSLGAMMTTFGFVLGLLVIRYLFRQYVQGLLKMAECLRLMLTANRDFRVVPEGPPEVRQLAEATNDLAQQRDGLMDDVDIQIAAAKASVEEEKNRLAALMSELAQAVVVCNLDGRILLYNSRARLQFRALAQGSTTGTGGALIGLGRSIFSILERNQIDHALEVVHQRLQKGRRGGDRQLHHHRSRRPTAARANGAGAVDRRRLAGERHQRLRAHRREHHAEPGTGVAPRSGPAIADRRQPRQPGQYPRRGRQPDGLPGHGSGGTRALCRYCQRRGRAHEPAPRPDDERVRRFLEDPLAAGRRPGHRHHRRRAAPHRGATRAAEQDRGNRRRPVAARRELFAGLFDLRPGFPPARTLSNQGAAFPAAALRQAGLPGYHLGRARDVLGDFLHLGNGTDAGRQENSPLSLRDVIDRHGGEVWYQRDKAAHCAFFRLVLPVAIPETLAAAEAIDESQLRPEYYDFDLFHFRDQSIDLDRPLADLSYTVFDTETTGLEPAAGDEIIQIGAVRIVNSRMLRQENFNELVDPERLLRPEGIRIHGITDDMVRGQPSIDAVLPAFHDFCNDTVLVAHNAAFDMRFLQLKEERTGIVFSQPVLDTLLLSAVLHANQDSHQLEKIAERLGISIESRHNALGDALATSEVFLKMLPLLEQMGISTLRQALEASQKTYFARVKY
jgi:DNA polymerase III epsilon subunit family exonuclease